MNALSREEIDKMDLSSVRALYKRTGHHTIDSNVWIPTLNYDECKVIAEIVERRPELALLVAHDLVGDLIHLRWTSEHHTLFSALVKGNGINGKWLSQSMAKINESYMFRTQYNPAIKTLCDRALEAVTYNPAIASEIGGDFALSMVDRFRDYGSAYRLVEDMCRLAPNTFTAYSLKILYNAHKNRELLSQGTAFPIIYNAISLVIRHRPDLVSIVRTGLLSQLASSPASPAYVLLYKELIKAEAIDGTWVSEFAAANRQIGLDRQWPNEWPAAKIMLDYDATRSRINEAIAQKPDILRKVDDSVLQYEDEMRPKLPEIPPVKGFRGLLQPPEVRAVHHILEGDQAALDHDYRKAKRHYSRAKKMASDGVLVAYATNQKDLMTRYLDRVDACERQRRANAPSFLSHYEPRGAL